MTTKRSHLNLKAAKARRQKLIAIGGAVLLAIVLVIQVPRTMKMLSGESSESVGPALTTTTTPTDPATGSVQPTALAVGELPDPNANPKPDEGQLTTFERFAGKDPFAQQVSETESPSPASLQAAPSGGVAVAATSAAPATSPADASAPTGARTLSSAVIAVNGAEQTVTVSKRFPQNDPAFVLLSATATSVKIGLAGGTFADGASGITLTRGKTLTLMNTVDGTRYVLEFRSIG
jgi:hypothetical protein